MLVLSRRQQDSVVFPNLNIRVNVLRIDGKTVRLGIEAPEDVRVLRHELADMPASVVKSKFSAAPHSSVSTPASTGEDSHTLRNQMNIMTLGLHLLRRQLESGELQDADASIGTVLKGLEELEQEIARQRSSGKLSSSAKPRTVSASPRALLVEDNPNESALLAGYLRSCNFEVATASDGVDALAYLAGHEHPDVVLLDMNMPRLDGCATICELRNNPATAGVKIFAVTGRTREEVGQGCCVHEVNRWFTKPIRPDVLVRELHRELGIVTSA